MNDIFNKLEKITKLSLAFIGFCFLIGYVISCFYLSNYGITDFSFIRLKHILTGASFLLYIIAPALIIFPIYHLFKNKPTIKRFFYAVSATLFVFITLSMIMLEIFWKPQIKYINILNFIFGGWSIYVKQYGLIIFGLYLLVVYLFLERKDRSAMSFISIIFIFTFIVSLFYYSFLVYPYTNSVFGGGEIRHIDIYIADQYVSTAKSMGFVFTKDTDKYTINNVTLIHETEDNLYIKHPYINTTKFKDVICLSKKGVNGLFIH
ncbi:hypothetical protein HZA73_06620 [candidate division TA06 bacterium]|nr:hypothetical protein [candidate division TA06 bacterium]